MKACGTIGMFPTKLGVFQITEYPTTRQQHLNVSQLDYKLIK